MSGLTLVIVHQPEQIEAVIAFARGVADRSGEEGERWVAVFKSAAELAGQRVPIMPQPMPSIELPGLKLS